MLDNYFSSPQLLQRLRSGSTGPFLDTFAAALTSAGFKRATVRDHLNTVGHLGVWTRTRGIAVADFDERVVERFIGHLPKCRCLDHAPGRRHGGAGTRAFMEHLHRMEAGAGRREPPPQSSPLRSGFRSWMIDQRGVTTSTFTVYEHIVTKLLDSLGDDVSRLDARRLRGFVLEQAAPCGRHYAQLIATAVRMLVRYLIVQGLCPADLGTAIPPVAHWRHAALPHYLPADTIERIIGACDIATGSGLRDRAVLLLLARLGLRAGDVAALRLGDFDWTRGRISVRGKSRREAWLPLPQEVGNSILAYLEQARPPVVGEYVFARVLAPLAPLRAAAVSKIVDRAMARAAVDSRFRGAHVLRHSVATDLLKQGLPLQGIGTVLRHRDIETTAIYAKVDVSMLQLVVQEWPGKEATPC